MEKNRLEPRKTDWGRIELNYLEYNNIKHGRIEQGIID